MLTRLVIKIPQFQVDVPLESTTSVRDIISDLVPYIYSQLSMSQRDTSFFHDHRATYSLSTIADQPLNPDQSLQDQRIYEGSTLYLTKTDRTEKYQALIDDVPEALAHFQKLHYSPWDHNYAAKITPTIVTATLIVLAVGIGLYTLVTPIMGPTRWAILATITTASILSLVIAAVFNKKIRTVYPLTAGYCLAAIAGILAIPRHFSHQSLLVCATVIVTAAIIMSVAIPQEFMLNTLVATIGIITLIPLACTLSDTINAYLNPTTMIVSSWVLILSLYILASAHSLSIVLARVQIPYLPPTKDAYEADFDDMKTLQSVPIPRLHEVEKIITQEDRIIAAREYVRGIIIAVMITSAISAFTLGYSMDTAHSIWCILLIYAMALMFFGRAKSNDDSVIQTIMHTGIEAFMIAWISGLAMSPHPHTTTPLVMSIVLLVIANTVGLIRVMRHRVITSPIIVKIIEVAEYALWATPIFYAGMIMDIISKARGR